MPAATDPCGTGGGSADRPLTVLHINGIRTDRGGYRANVAALRTVACGAGVLVRGDRLGGYFDPTQSLLGYNLREGFTGDFPDALRGWARAHELGSWATDAARPFAEMIRDEVGRGRRVLVVAHSRGNLVTQDALARLMVSRPDLRRCVRVVAVAPPDARHWPDLDQVAGLFSQGAPYHMDPLLRFSTVTAEGFPADVARRFRIVRTQTPTLEYAGDITLHSFTDTYLSDPATRAVITRYLTDAAFALRTAPCAAADYVLDGPPDDTRPVPALAGAGRAQVSAWSGTWADVSSRGAAFLWQIGADGKGRVAAGGILTMPKPVRVAVVPAAVPGGADSVYLSEEGFLDRGPVLRGTVARGTGGTLVLTYVQALIPKSCQSGTPAHRGLRWSAPSTVMLARIGAAAFAAAAAGCEPCPARRAGSGQHIGTAA